jgi:hypothetical protein
MQIGCSMESLDGDQHCYRRHGVSARVMVNGIELLGTEVMPQVRKELG